MYIPKKQKYLKYQKKRNYKVYSTFNSFLFGDVACKNLTISYLTNKHLHRLMFYFKRLNKKKKYNLRRIWLPYFPNIPIFKKSRNARMGKGKGSKSNWKVILQPNLSLIESRNTRLGRFIQYVNIVATRLPIKLNIIHKRFT